MTDGEIVGCVVGMALACVTLVLVELIRYMKARDERGE